MTTIEDVNAPLREAVKSGIEATPADDPKMARNGGETYAAWTPPPFACETPAVSTLRQSMEAVRDRHGKYGPPTEHFARTAALVNAAFGTTFTAADWALVMVLDKVARQRGTAPTADAAIDIAGYAACHEECRKAGA